MATIDLPLIYGKLEKITDEATFDPRLIAHRPGLREVRCDVIGGLIFINIDGEAPPLREWICNLDDADRRRWAQLCMATMRPINLMAPARGQ